MPSKTNGGENLTGFSMSTAHVFAVYDLVLPLLVPFCPYSLQLASQMPSASFKSSTKLINFRAKPVG